MPRGHDKPLAGHRKFRWMLETMREKYWFPRVTRIDIHVVVRASEVPKIECLAIDRFEPLRNKVRSARTPYSKKCPVCTPARKIRLDLLKLFRLRV